MSLHTTKRKITHPELVFQEGRLGCVSKASSADVANHLPLAPYPGILPDSSLRDIGEPLSFPHDIAADNSHRIRCTVAVSRRCGVPRSGEGAG